MIIREVFVKLLLDSFVKLSISYLVVREFDVVHRKNWLLENKDEIGIPTEKELVGFTPRHRIGFRMKFVQGATPIWHRARGVCLTSLEARGLGLMAGELQGEVVRMVTCCGTRLYCLVRKKKVGSWTCVRLSRGGVRVPREDDRGVSEGREDVCEVFQQHRSGAKRKLSRCGRNQMGNELILALPEGADDFIVYYDARTKDLEACLEKGEEALNVNETMETVSIRIMNVSNTLSIERIKHEAKMMDGCYLVSLVLRPSTIWERQM
ncbi:hypothetical protein Tco_0782272 [Tanacetum coccineum]